MEMTVLERDRLEHEAAMRRLAAEPVQSMPSAPGWDSATTAWAQGWRAGFYAPRQACPYKGTALERAWSDGYEYGFDAKFIVRNVPRFSADAEAPEPSRTARQITDGELADIAKAYVSLGGTMTYVQMESKFGLRPANGMTAKRIVDKYKRMAG